MKRKLSSFNGSVIRLLRLVNKQSINGENILKISEFRRYRFLIIFLIIVLFIYASIIYNIQWEEVHWAYISSFLLSLILTFPIYYLLKYRMFDSFLYFDESVIISKHGNIVDFIPVKEIDKCIVYDKKESEDFIKIRIVSITDNGESFSFEYLPGNKHLAVVFINKINNSKCSVCDSESILYKNIKFDKGVVKSEKSNLIRKSILLIFISMLTFSFMPYCVDFNSFRLAKDTNTAAGFRKYLSNDNNKLFIEESKECIRKKYDVAIELYHYHGTSSVAYKEMVKMIQYLKDNELYVVDVNFKSYNEIYDHKNSTFKTVVSAKDFFTVDNIKQMEDQLVNSLNKIIGGFFPVDIICLHNEKSVSQNPIIQISYKYRNNDNGLLYYETSQEYVNEQLRRYYYGITIEWKFEMFFPNENKSYFDFILESSPAVVFQAQDDSDSSIYSNMVFSAFKDFENKFRDFFFKKKE